MNTAKPNSKFARLSAVVSVVLILASVALFLAGRYWLGAAAFYVGATVAVVLFMHCAKILSYGQDDNTTV